MGASSKGLGASLETDHVGINEEAIEIRLEETEEEEFEVKEEKMHLSVFLFYVMTNSRSPSLALFTVSLSLPHTLFSLSPFLSVFV